MLLFFTKRTAGGSAMACVDVRVELRNLFLQTKATLKTERSIALQAVKDIGQLHSRNPWVNLGMNESEFLSHLGISRDKYYSRVRAARAFMNFPGIEAAFIEGKVALSTIGMIESKLTRDNFEVVLENIGGKTKRESTLFMSKVMPSGEIADRPGSIEILITLSEDELKAFNRLREIFSAKGRNPKNSDILTQAVKDSLEKRDPILKAQRSEERRQKHETNVTLDKKDQKTQSLVVPVQQLVPKRFIPAHIRHSVWLRDMGQCTHRFSNWIRCEETAHIEIDHIKMFCRGGGNDVDNLRLVCRRHNQFYAQAELGKDFMESKRLRA
jgi:hypothetical protein